MPNFFSVLVVFLVLGVALAAPPQIHHDHHPDDHSGHCHIAGHPDIHLHIGDWAPIPGECLRATCLNPEGDQVSLTGCPQVSAKEGCVLSQQDNSKDYPECCPKVVCN